VSARLKDVEVVYPDREPIEYAADTLEARLAYELASVECADARQRFFELHAEVDGFRFKHDQTPAVLQEATRLKAALGEADLEKRRTEDAVRETGGRWKELQARDQYAHRRAAMQLMYQRREAEDRAREEALRRRRSLFGRLRR